MPFLSVDDLRRNKLASGRLRDLADAVGGDWAADRHHRKAEGTLLRLSYCSGVAAP